MVLDVLGEVAYNLLSKYVGGLSGIGLVAGLRKRTLKRTFYRVRGPLLFYVCARDFAITAAVLSATRPVFTWKIA